MKRICYLLLWLLTGFSIAANENGARQTHQHSESRKVCALQETEINAPSSEVFFPADESENSEKPQCSLIPVNNLICSAKR